MLGFVEKTTHRWIWHNETGMNRSTSTLRLDGMATCSAGYIHAGRPEDKFFLVCLGQALDKTTMVRFGHVSDSPDNFTFGDSQSIPLP